MVVLDTDHRSLLEWSGAQGSATLRGRLASLPPPEVITAIISRLKPLVWLSWQMDETDIKVKGEWKYLSRAVDKSGQTIDFLLTDQHDERAATCFLTKAIRRHGVLEQITIDGSEANAAALRGYSEAHSTAIDTRQVKYLNNMVEQDHHGVKRVTRPMLWFKSFEAACNFQNYVGSWANGIKLGKAKRGGCSKFRYLQLNNFAISTLFRA